MATTKTENAVASEAAAEKRTPGRKKASRAKGSGCVFLPKCHGKILSHIYRARWIVDGKVYTRTTGKSKKKDAEAVLEGFVKPFLHKTDQERERAILKKLTEGKPSVTLDGAFDVYRKSKYRPQRASAATLDRYEGQYLELVAWLRENHPEVDGPRQVTEDIAMEFAKELKATRSAGTYNKRVTLFRSVWHCLSKDAGLVANPWRDVSREANVSEPVRRNLTDEEVAAVIRAADGELRLLFLVGFFTGFRLSDCCLLEWKRVDLKEGFIRIMPHKTAKKRLMVKVPMRPEFAAILAHFPARARKGYVMPRIAEEFIHNSPVISKRIQATFEAAGIKTHEGTSESGRACVEVGFHSLRHSFISNLANSGVPRQIVQRLAGHSTPSMTDHYFHESDEALKSAVAMWRPTIMDPTVIDCEVIDQAKDTPAALPAPETATATAGDSDASESRFSRFCAMLDEMSADELKRARAEIDSRMGKDA